MFHLAVWEILGSGIGKNLTWITWKSLLSQPPNLYLSPSLSLTSGLSLLNSFRKSSIITGQSWWKSARQCFPSMIYSQVNEIIKRLSVAERMGELWASGSHAASALRTLEGRGVCSDVFNLRTVTLFMDCPGCAWACDLRLSIWFCEGIVADTWHMHFGVSLLGWPWVKSWGLAGG